MIFPLPLKDADDEVIAEKYATAKGEWMTQYFVPFEGTLILKKGNSTGRPEHDDAREIPVFFE
jgi:hypothetical protein